MPSMTGHVTRTGIAAENDDKTNEIERRVASGEAGRRHMRPLSYSPRPLKSSRPRGHVRRRLRRRRRPSHAGQLVQHLRRDAVQEVRCMPARLCGEWGSTSIIVCAVKVTLYNAQ